MNIAFFLTPKNEVICENLEATMRQVMERMEHHGYTAIPLIDKHGRYVSTLTEGDLLWKLKNTPDLNFKNTESVRVKDIKTRRKHKSVSINGIFIGIIKRSDIINYCYNEIKKESY